MKNNDKICSCGGTFYLLHYCGALVCDECGQHKGMDRCFCGWSRSGNDGRQELIDMGENIDPE